VARIVRIVEAPGVSTASLSLPSSNGGPDSGATSVSIPSEPHAAKPKRAGIVVVALVAAAVVGVLALRETTPKPRAEQREASVQGATTATATSTSTVRVEPVAQEPERAEAVGAAPSMTAAPRVNAQQPPVAAAKREPASTPSTKRVTDAVERASADASLGPAAATASGASTAPPPAALAATSATASAPAVTARSAGSSSPWIVDIVEQRKAKPGEGP
jgi:hypothetical protein